MRLMSFHNLIIPGHGRDSVHNRQTAENVTREGEREAFVKGFESLAAVFRLGT